MRQTSVAYGHKKLDVKNIDIEFHWLRKLWGVDEEEIRGICGNEVALYLTYLRYCSTIFGIIALTNCVFLLPMFATGEAQEVTSLETLTLTNIMEESYKAYVVLFFTVLYSMMGHMLLFFFDEKRKQWKVDTENMDPTEMTEIEISYHSLIVRGVNESVPWAKAEKRVEKIFKELLEDEVVGVHCIADYEHLLTYMAN